MKSPSRTINLLVLLVAAFAHQTMTAPSSFEDSTVSSSSNKGQQALSDHWVMKMSVNDLETAQKIAREHNFKVVRRVGSLDGYFVIVANDEHRFRRSSSSRDDQKNLSWSWSSSTASNFTENLVSNMQAHPLIESVEKEPLLVRTKRDFIELPIRSSISHVLLNSDLARQQRLAEVAAMQPLDGQLQQQQQQQSSHGIDPFWSEMWYLNRASTDPRLPDMNVTSAWAQGYSGRGVSVTFLDDGLEWNHADLMANYDPKASTDINGNDDDPMPRYDDSNENKHGTRCAGEVAAVANNSVCGVGVAFNSGIGGIRMLDGDVTDSVEASSLGYNIDHIHIYSASWGPDDNGEVVDGPGPLAKRAFYDGVMRGRRGLGNIFVWASGNGGRFNDSCSCDGYANSIYTFSISSTSERGDKPWYLEECASTLATTYSSGDERYGEKEIITTDIRNKCTTKHTGTSAAAPIAAGIIALALEANPKLTWRDVMYVIAVTSRPDAIRSNNYIINKRGFKVSPRYGFGLMNAGGMVEVAKTWRNVPPMISCVTINSQFRVNTVHKINSLEAVLSTDACAGTPNEVNFIEQVEVIVSIRAPVRGQLEVFLTSPMGTKSHLLPKRSRDLSADGFKRWPFMTVHLWGEMPRGDWLLTVTTPDGTIVQVEEYSLVIHGTKEKPIDYERFVKPDPSNNFINADVAVQTKPMTTIASDVRPQDENNVTTTTIKTKTYSGGSEKLRNLIDFLRRKLNI